MPVLGPVPVVGDSVPAAMVTVNLDIQLLLVEIRQVTVLHVRGIVQASYLCSIQNRKQGFTVSGVLRFRREKSGRGDGMGFSILK